MWLKPGGGGCFSFSFQKEMAHAAFIEFAAVMFVFISELLDRISLGRRCGAGPGAGRQMPRASDGGLITAVQRWDYPDIYNHIK